MTNRRTWKAVFSQVDLKYCTLKIHDGAGHDVEMRVGDGTLQWTEKKNIEYQLDRGLLDEVREGDQVPVEVSFDLIWDYIKSTGSTWTVHDILTNNNNHFTSSDNDTCRPYAVDIEVVYDPQPSGCAGGQETILLSDFRVEELQFDTKEGKISCSGKCNIVKATTTRP
jgi:hypothetical protein